MRRRQARVLAPMLVRCVRWQPVLGAAALSGLLLWWQHEDLAGGDEALLVLRLVAVLLAAAVSFALDDRARAALAGVPSPLWWRSALALALPLALAATVWVLATAWVSSRVAGGLPVAALSLEAGALAMTGLALAGLLCRWRDLPEPGAVTGPLVLAMIVLLPQLPARVALHVAPGPAWTAAHLRWSVLLAVALAVLLTSVRDPARRPLRVAVTAPRARP